MTENVVFLDAHRPPPNPGNGAREALLEMLGSDFTMEQVDWLLIALWMHGFKVVPA
jgi:hypothetical protein